MKLDPGAVEELPPPEEDAGAPPEEDPGAVEELSPPEEDPAARGPPEDEQGSGCGTKSCKRGGMSRNSGLGRGAIFVVLEAR